MSAPGPIEVVVGVGAAAPQRAPEPDTFETPDPLVAEGLVSDNKETSLYSTSMGGIGGGATSAASNFQKQVESGNLTLDKTSVSSKEALEHFSKLGSWSQRSQYSFCLRLIIPLLSRQRGQDQLDLQASKRSSSCFRLVTGNSSLLFKGSRGCRSKSTSSSRTWRKLRR